MSALLDLPGLREGVAALRVPRGVLYQDALRWKVLLVPASATPEGAQRWLGAQGMLAGAPVPKATPRLSQIFLVRRDEAPVGELRLMPEARFSCVCCGNSCRSLNLGPLLPADVDRLLELDWSGTGHDPARFFIFRDGEDATAGDLGSRDLFLRRNGDACQFLQADHLCNVHARFGAGAKPQMCRAFPLEFRASPGGVVVGMRLGECLSAQEATQGERVAPRLDEVQALYEELPRVPLLPPLLWLADGALGRWQDLLALDQRVLSSPRPDQGGLPLFLRALAEVEAMAGGGQVAAAAQADLEPLRAASRGEKTHLPVVQGRAAGLDQSALQLEELICRASLFAKDYVQHTDVASGIAMLAIEAWMARERALGLAAAQGAQRASAAHLNAGWKEVTALRVRHLLADQRLPSRAAAAAIAQLI